MTITEFLEARIAEDEAVARERPVDAHIHQSGCYYYDYSLDSGWFCDCDEDGKATARVLAECAAKRAIIAAHPIVDDVVEVSTRIKHGFACETCFSYGDIVEDNGYCDTLRALAAVYADHADYRSEWAL